MVESALIEAAIWLIYLDVLITNLFVAVTTFVHCVYHYTDRLGYKVLDLVPLLIPMAWFMMTYPSYIIAERIIPSSAGTWGWWLTIFVTFLREQRALSTNF